MGEWVRFVYFCIRIIGSVVITRPAWFGGDERSGLFCTGNHWADPFANGCTVAFWEGLVLFLWGAEVASHFFALRARHTSSRTQTLLTLSGVEGDERNRSLFLLLLCL